MRRPVSPGFTLLELLVALALLGALLGVAAWSLARSARQAAVREAAALVAADLRRARSEVRRTSLSTEFRLSDDAASYFLGAERRTLPVGTRLTCLVCPRDRAPVTYTPPFAELAAAVGVVLRVEGASGTAPLLVKVIGVTGKVAVTREE